MAYGYDEGRIKINSGGIVKFEFGASPAWENVGSVASGVLNNPQEEVGINQKSGRDFTLPGRETCSIEIVLNQTSKEELDLPDILGRTPFKLYIYNGKDDTKHQEIYAPKCRIIKKTSLNMEGNTQQTLALFIAVAASVQADTFAVTPDTALPAGKFATGAAPVNSKNPYFIILDTVIA